MPMMYIKSSIWSGFEVKNWIEDQFQSSPKLVGIWTVLRCICLPNLEIVTSIGDELCHRKAQNGVNFYFGVQFDLEGHNQSFHKTIGILTKVFYISGPNLVILAETSDELSRGQARDWRTDGHTDRCRQRQYPKAKTGLGLKKQSKSNQCAYLTDIPCICLRSIVSIPYSSGGSAGRKVFARKCNPHEYRALLTPENSW